MAPNGFCGDVLFLLPVRAAGICAMGFWIIDSGNYESLVEVFARENRWKGMFVTSHLSWEYATGSPLNHAAIFWQAAISGKWDWMASIMAVCRSAKLGCNIRARYA